MPTPSRPIWVDARSPSLTRAAMCGASCWRLGAVMFAVAVMALVCSGLAQGLQGADVVHDGPSVFDGDAWPVGRHRALAVGDHFEELAVGHQRDAVVLAFDVVEVRKHGHGPPPADHAVALLGVVAALARVAVADGAVDVEAIATALDHGDLAAEVDHLRV